MTIELFTLVYFGLFFGLLALGVPLVWACAGLGLIFGYIVMGSALFPWFVFRTWSLLSSFGWIAIPLFIFMANVLQHSGIADSMYKAFYIWLGKLRGGLAVATVLVCSVLAAMVGTAGAGVVLMGMIAYPFMMQHNYDRRLAIGSILGGGTLGVLIPPSIMFVIYGTFTGQSIGKLFMGGMVPGLVLAGLYCSYILVKCWLQPEAGPPPPKEIVTASLLHRIKLLRGLILPILLILAVLGSIYGGLCTPSEAAGVGAIGAIICAAVHRQLTWQTVKLSVYGTIRPVAMIMWIAIGAYLFVGVYLYRGGSEFINTVLFALPLGKWGLFILVQLVFIALGMVISETAIIFLVIPIILPVVTELGFDPLWFAIVFAVNMQIGFLTPPYGNSLFYLKGVMPQEVSIIDIYRAAIPFIILQLIGLTLVVLFPQIALWLPSKIIG